MRTGTFRCRTCETPHEISLTPAETAGLVEWLAAGKEDKPMHRHKPRPTLLSKATSEGEPIEFDFAAPPLTMGRGDRRRLSIVDPEEYQEAVEEAQRTSMATGKSLVMPPEPERDESLAVPRATQQVILGVVGAKFAQRAAQGGGIAGGINNRDNDRKTWAMWQQMLTDDPTGVVKVPRAKVEWLKAQFNDKNVDIPHGHSMWAEQMLDYLENVLKAAPVDESVGA